MKQRKLGRTDVRVSEYCLDAATLGWHPAADDADTVLEITLTKFWLDPVAYEAGKSSTANQYRMSIKASFVLRRRADNSVVVDSPSVTGWYDFDFAGDMTSSKAVALRPAAEDLGRRIVNNIVQYWPPAQP